MYFPMHLMHANMAAKVEVWYEWEHIKRPNNGTMYPHRVYVQAGHIASGKQKVPLNSFYRCAPNNLYFNVMFMPKIAALNDNGITYQGMTIADTSAVTVGFVMCSVAFKD
jgi:hypothetical protein